jgi:hypothetical protein
MSTPARRIVARTGSSSLTMPDGSIDGSRSAVRIVVKAGSSSLTTPDGSIGEGRS